MATLAERFAAHVDTSGEHHRWLGAVDRRGTPQMRYQGRLTTARRIAWELDRESLPSGTRLRGCPADPRCVRTDHLSPIPPAATTAKTATRRPRGQGSLRESRPGVWQLSITVTAAPGHTQRVHRTINGDRTTAEAALIAIRAERDPQPATLDALIARYLGHLRQQGRTPQTLRRYQQLWRTWLAPKLATVHPDDLRRRHIEHALKRMANANQSERSIHQAAVVLNSALGWAHTQGHTRTNPVIGCKLPNGAHITATRRR